MATVQDQGLPAQDRVLCLLVAEIFFLQLIHLLFLRGSAVQMLLHRDAFTHAEMTFTYLYIQILLQRDDFTLSKIIHRCQNKERRCYKGMHLHEELLPMGIFAQTYYFLIFDRGHAYGAKKFSQHMQNHGFTAAF